MRKLFILTDADHPELLEEDQALINAFADQNIEAVPVIWDEFNPSAGSLILIRTPWDYALKHQAFLKLLDNIDQNGANLINSTEVIRWNLNKEYLCELAQLNIPVVETKVFKNVKLTDALSKETFPLVLKPLVGCAGRDTFLLNSIQDISKCVALEGRDILLQPFIPSIQSEGEHSFIFFEGKFSHSVLKKAKSGEFRVQEEHGGRVEIYSPLKSEIRQIEESLRKIKFELTYARVDVVEHAGKLLLMELEVIEPQLFFSWAPEGVSKLTQAVSSKF